jgi:hypothetical protein
MGNRIRGKSEPIHPEEKGKFYFIKMNAEGYVAFFRFEKDFFILGIAWA